MRLLLVIALFYQIGSFLTFTTNEGRECELEDGGKGVCTLIIHCPSKFKEVGERITWWESPDRCGFNNFTEIVCCAEVAPRRQLRPAAMACEEYRERYYRDPKRRKRTFNENEAHDVEFSYAAALVYNATEEHHGVQKFYYLCAGTLISDQYVLTAAKCIDHSGRKVPVEVHLGDRESNSSDWVRIPIEEITVHPEYKPHVHYNDLAVIKLKRKVQMTHNIKPICLQTHPLSEGNVSLAKFLIAIEWLGATISPEASHRVTGQYFRIVNKEQCNKYYSPSPRGLPNGIVSSQVCVKSKGIVGPQVCEHRNGSPLLMLNDSDNTLVGVTSSGWDCGYIYPVICTEVYAHLDWIEEKVWPSLNRI